MPYAETYWAIFQPTFVQRGETLYTKEQLNDWQPMHAKWYNPSYFKKTLRCSKKVVVKKIFLKAQKSQILPQLHLYLTWRKLDLLLEVISVLLNLYLTKFLILFLKFWERKINVINLLFTFNRCKLLNYEVFRAGKPVFNLCHLT